MNIIFWGSDQVAAAHLENLIRNKYFVRACVTQPDKPKGRFLHMTAPYPKQVALRDGIDVLQPNDLQDRDFLTKLKSYAADLFIVIAYGRILTPEILSIPRLFGLNVHASLLPQYRGAAPINWAMINGEEKTGVTIMKMSAQLDAGDILLQQAIRIDPLDDAVSLKEKIIAESLGLLTQALKQVEQGSCCFIPQDPNKVSFAPKLTKDHGRIDWHKPAAEIHRLIRGLTPWPGAYTFYHKKMLKILESQVVESVDAVSPGCVADISPKGIVVSTAQQALLIQKVHLEASRAMEAQRFVLGHKLLKGFCFS